MKSRKEIFKMCDEKMLLGEKKYGTWNPSKDSRNLPDEIIQELVDTINYSVMLIQKVELLKKKNKA